MLFYVQICCFTHCLPDFHCHCLFSCWTIRELCIDNNLPDPPCLYDNLEQSSTSFEILMWCTYDIRRKLPPCEYGLYNDNIHCMYQSSGCKNHTVNQWAKLSPLYFLLINVTFLNRWHPFSFTKKASWWHSAGLNSLRTQLWRQLHLGISNRKFWISEFQPATWVECSLQTDFWHKNLRCKSPTLSQTPRWHLHTSTALEVVKYTVY